ncbi:IPT/TIG domain-containing protein [Longispora urticae]
MATCDVTQTDLTARAATLTAAATKATTDAAALNSQASTLEAAAAVTSTCRARLVSANNPLFVEPIDYLMGQIDGKNNSASALRSQALALTQQATAATAEAAAFTAAAAGLAPLTPTVTGVAPSSGTTLGGTSVVVTGTNFTDATGVTFGGTPATGVVIDSDTQITCVTPAHAAGAVTVAVAVTGSSGTLPSGFTYLLVPTLTTVAPGTGAPAGGTSMTLTGTGFTGATKVQFGTTDATAFNVASATSITCTSPAGSGTVDVTVFHPNGNVTKPASFEYA